jgi:hypothetical protein
MFKDLQTINPLLGHTEYRSDIDGLRAVAVVLIVASTSES